MAMVCFRNATESDAITIALLVNAAYRPNAGVTGWTHESELVDGDRTTPKQVSEFICKPDTALLLGLEGNETVACALIEKADRISHVGMFAVRPELQAAGKGKCMLAEAERYAVSNFGAEILRMTVISARSELIAFYERRGYRKTGVSIKYPHDSGVGSPKYDGLKVIVLERVALPESNGTSNQPDA